EGGLSTREFFVKDEAPVSFRLEAPEGDAAAVEALGAVVHGYKLLPPEERRLSVRESWLSVELAGEWQPLGTGAYVRTRLPVILLTTQRIGATPGLKTYAEGAARTLKQAPDVRAVAREESREGPFKGVAGWRDTLDFTDRDGPA